MRSKYPKQVGNDRVAMEDAMWWESWWARCEECGQSTEQKEQRERDDWLRRHTERTKHDRFTLGKPTL